MAIELHRDLAGGVPLIWAEPAEKTARKRLAIWLSGLSGTKEGAATYVQQLAEAGFYAIAYDKYQHGERRNEPAEAVGPRVHGNFFKYAWPVIANSALDATTVIDWAIENLKVEPRVCMGGISMGGDTSCAAAGMDRRIIAAACTIATPDWKRPGWSSPDGEADAYSQTLYDRYCPIIHPEHYQHRPAIAFFNGADDKLVPPEAAHRFVKSLASTYRDSPERLHITDYPNTGHKFTENSWKDALAWLLKFGKD